MTSWSVDPVGGPWFLIVVAGLMILALLVGPSARRLSRQQRLTLIALRSGTALLLLFAMLRPTLVATEIHKLPGSLILMVDSSRSMKIADSVGNRSRWDALRTALDSAKSQFSELAESWDLRLYRFDETTTVTEWNDGEADLPEKPDGPQTAIGSALEDVLQREAQQRIVAVLLMSDGAQRAFAPRDVPPQSVARRLANDGTPLYTITFGKPALGLQSDLRIEDLLVGDTVFAETPVHVEATVGTDGYVNQTVNVQLLWESVEGEMEVVDTRQVLIKSNRRRIPVSLSHTPLVPGEYKISVKITSPEGELATNNNEQSTFVSVLKGGVNVLYLVGATRIGGGPSIEPRFIRGALAAHADIDVQYELFDYRKRPLDIRQQLREGKYDVYLLGDLDDSALDRRSWEQIALDVENGAGLAMLGGFHSFGPGGFRGSPLGNALPVRIGRAERQNFGEPLRKDMHHFSPLRLVPTDLGRLEHPILNLDDDGENPLNWKALPLLDGANRLDRSMLRPNARVIAESDNAGRWPLLVTGAWGEGRNLALAVDSTWRWQMEGFGEVHRRFWRQLVLWLGRKDETDGQAVWVRFDGRRYQRGSQVHFSLGAFDDKREPVSSATFNIEVQKPDGSSVTVNASRRGKKLVGNFGETTLPGDYRVTVTANDRGAVLGTTEARFLVPDQDMELDQPAAEPTLLASLANLTSEAGGRGLAPEELPGLLEQLKSRTSEFEEEISKKRTLWDTWPLLLMLVGILGGEWWLRKRWGLV